MWIGLADEKGCSWYGISSEVDIDPATDINIPQWVAGVLLFSFSAP